MLTDYSKAACLAFALLGVISLGYGIVAASRLAPEQHAAGTAEEAEAPAAGEELIPKAADYGPVSRLFAPPATPVAKAVIVGSASITETRPAPQAAPRSLTYYGMVSREGEGANYYFWDSKAGILIRVGAGLDSDGIEFVGADEHSVTLRVAGKEMVYEK